jgi:hypothetical protein
MNQKKPTALTIIITSMIFLLVAVALWGYYVR